MLMGGIQVIRESGQKRSPCEEKSGLEVHRASGEVRWLRRVFDRRNGRYYELVVDPQGNVVREVDEPLSAHQGRGSARRRRQRRTS